MKMFSKTLGSLFYGMKIKIYHNMLTSALTIKVFYLYEMLKVSKNPLPPQRDLQNGFMFFHLRHELRELQLSSLEQRLTAVFLPYLSVSKSRELPCLEVPSVPELLFPRRHCCHSGQEFKLWRLASDHSFVTCSYRTQGKLRKLSMSHFQHL